MTHDIRKGPRLKQTAGIIEGLVSQAEQRTTRARTAWGALAAYHRPPDPCATAAHCFRSPAQRTLSFPIAYLTNPLSFDPAADPYLDVLTALDLPARPLDLSAANFRNFYDNDGAERQEVHALVLIALRARLVVAYAGKQPEGSIIRRRRDNTWIEAIPAFARQYLSFRLTYNADLEDPFVIDTPLAYIDRPDRQFYAVPPMIWRGRDTTGRWVSRRPDFNPISSPAPTLDQGGAAPPSIGFLTASFLVEGLFVPDPGRCRDVWPGSNWCPSEVIANHPKFNRAFCRD